MAAGVALAAAFAGNLLDSVLGATIERRGLVTNDMVNFAGTSFAGGLALGLVLRFRFEASSRGPRVAAVSGHV
jgi:uncharacterized membrane protein